MIQPKCSLLIFSILLAFCFSPIGLFGNNAPANDYCASSSNFPWEDWIAKVDISNLSNASGKTPYSDFTNKEVNLNSGDAYTIELSTGYSYFTQEEYWRVWIDYNADGDFDDASETVFSGILDAPVDGTPSATLNGSFFIPTGAPEFSTRMRVAMTRGDFSDPCAVLEFGEVEDYTVNITNTNALPDLSFVSHEFFPGEHLCFTKAGTPFLGIYGTILNSGPVDSAPYKVSFHWSKDDELSADDVLWTELEYPGLQAGYVEGLSLDDPVPSSLEPGLYFLIVQVDSDNEITESREENNFIRSPQYIDAPDFSVGNINGTPASTSAGEAINVSVDLTNLQAFPLDEWNRNIKLTLRLATEPILSSTNAPEIGSLTLSADQFSNAPTYLNGTATANIAGLIPTDTPVGDYYLFVQMLNSCDYDRSSDLSSPKPIQITIGTSGTYCVSTSDYPWEEWISGVAIANLDNTSGKTNYSDFTAQSATLSIGDFNTIKLTSAYSYFTEDEYWRIWVDLNKDGDFFDVGEMILERISLAPADGTPSKSIQDGFQIPAGTMPGTTRMRVSMKRGAFPEPCETLPFGEVEDYNLQMNDDGPLPNLVSPSFEFIPGGTFLCYSDLQDGFANFGVTLLSIGETTEAFKVRVTWSKDDQMSADDVVWREFTYDGLGDFMAEGFNLNGVPLPSSLEPGIYYVFVAIDADDDIAESNELDNIIKSRQQLGAPDYIIEDLSGLPTVLSGGESFTFSMSLKNLNAFPLTQNFGNLPVNLYLSSDASLEIFNDELIGSVEVDFDEFSNPPFYLNGLAMVDLTAAIPSNVATGDYFLFARVGGTNCETNKLNNLSSGFPLEITDGNSGTYCTADSNFPWHEWIENVSIGTLDNTSAKSNYSDFTNLSANLDVGNFYPLSLTTGFSYFTEDEFWSVWIDFNQNKVFEGSELVHSQMVAAPADGIGSNTVTGTIYIPSDAMVGSTRMRVAMNRGSFANACGTIPFGEVEDYSIIIGNNSPNNRSTLFPLDLQQNRNSISLEGFFQTVEEVSSLTIEKSSDGERFNLFEKLSPSRNADGLYWINSKDTKPFEGSSFYRAVAYLKNGQKIYSAIQSIDFEPLGNFVLSPNPARSQILLTFKEANSEPIHWTIQDAYGRLLWSKEQEASEQRSFQIDIKHLKPGMYYVIGKRSSRKAWTKKFVVVQ